MHIGLKTVRLHARIQIREPGSEYGSGSESNNPNGSDSNADPDPEPQPWLIGHYCPVYMSVYCWPFTLSAPVFL